MNEDQPPAPDNRGWLERLGKSLLGEPADQEQLIEILHNAQRRNLLDADVLAMIEGALQVARMAARDIMIPRPQMEVLSDQDKLEDMLKVIIDSGHSRFPVTSDKKDNVIGIVLAKDLLRYLAPSEAQSFQLDDVLRPVVFIPESKRLNILLTEFRDSRNHMAVVVDEYGMASGLVTIEDVLEQIVGEIDDEHDVEEVENAILKKEANQFSIKALTPIEEFNEYFSTNFEEEEFDTVGGLILKYFGHLPKRGENIVIGDFYFEVLKADSRRIQLLKMSRESGIGSH
jgi:magnesium and cobalt transporter